jgi:hypothetical protein
VLTASWIKEKALDVWDMRNCSRKISNLNIKTTKTESNDRSSSAKTNNRDGKNGEYLYACKFFSISDYNPSEPSLENGPRRDPAPSPKSQQKNDSTLFSKASRSSNCFPTVLACGSGTQSLHLIDYEEQSRDKQHLASISCGSPLYCLDAMYSSSLIACGGMNYFYTMMASSNSSSLQNALNSLDSTGNFNKNANYEYY